MKRKCISMLMLVLSMVALAQQKSDKYEPAWMRGDMPAKTNQSYDFRTMTGQGGTLTDARRDATMALLNELMQAQGVTVSGTEKVKMLSQSVDGEHFDSSLFDSEYNIEYGNHRYAFKAVDEYWELVGGIYQCHILFEVARNAAQVSFETVEYTTNYGVSAGLRSVIVPGWGQMYKRQTVKGVAILSAAVIGATGIVISDNQRASYRNKAEIATNVELRNSYQNKSNSWGNVRNGFIVGTAAVYVYNLVDAFASKGAKRYKKRNMAVVPFVGANDSFGMSIALNF